MHNFKIPSETFYTMTYSRFEQIVRLTYGKQYDAHEGLLHAGGLHTFTVLAAPLSEYAQEELDRFLAEDGYHPHPLVLLNDLARQGDIPAGSYLI
jgi:hypothetical protein